MTQPAVKWFFRCVPAGSAAIVAAIGLVGEPAFAQPAPGTSTHETRTGAIPVPPATPLVSQPGGAALSSAAVQPQVPAAIGITPFPQVAAVARAPLPAGQVGELNVMDAPPARGYAYAYPYAPASVPAPAFAPAPPDDPDYADNWGPDVLWAHGYARRNYIPRENHHIRPQPRPHPHPGRN
jgi:hypothetical protein